MRLLKNKLFSIYSLAPLSTFTSLITLIENERVDSQKLCDIDLGVSYKFAQIEEEFCKIEYANVWKISTPRFVWCVGVR